MEQTITKSSLAVGVYVSDNDILSDDDQMRLIQIRDSHRQDYFLIGGMANRYVRTSAAHGLPITASRVYEAIGRFSGKQPRTIRYYAEVAAFYEEKDISAFDMLPFSFFVVARRAGEIAWREVLEFAALNPYISLLELERAYDGGVFENIKKYENCLADTDYREGIQTDPTEGMRSSRVEPPPFDDRPKILSKYAASVLITSLSDMVEQVLRILKMVDLPDELRSRLELDIQDLKGAIPQVSRAIDKQKARAE